MKIQKQALSSTNSSIEEEVHVVPTPFCSLFLYHWGLTPGDTKYHLLRRFWVVLFPEESMPDSVPQEMLKNKLAYTFMQMDYKIAGKEMPAKCKQNLEASNKYDVKLMHKDMRRLVETDIKMEEEGGDNMGTKVKKTERTGVAPYYLEIFENQKRAQLTDEQIADVIEKKTGNRPSSKGVASYRCYYNAGTINGQKTAPKEKVKAVRPVKAAKAKKPMSQETKDKLKAYTAAKKAKKTGLKIAKKK